MSAAKRKVSETAKISTTRTPTSTRTTRLSSRVSEFHPRVTLFEPVIGHSSSLEDGGLHVIKQEEADVEDDAETPHLADDEIKAELSTPRRKRMKLDIADLEALAYIPPASSSPRKTRTKQAVKAEEPPNGTALSDSPSKSPLKAKGKAKAIPQSLNTPHPAPTNWEETYKTIKEMRSTFVAPVDTMGCDSAQTKETDPRNRRYATLVSLMLSSQTKDEVTDAAVKNLRTAFGGSISLEGMINAEDSVISEAIAKVGFWRRKTGYLKQAAIKLRDEFDSDLPKTVDELCSLPGVGPKMAFLALHIAWNLNHGIGVDVHVHRITNLLGWHKPPTKNPEQTRLNLQSWLPKDLHGEINHLLVGFGQVICTPVRPKCDECQLSVKGLCPSARKVVKGSKTKTQKTTKTKVIQSDKPAIEIEIEAEDTVVEEQETVMSPTGLYIN